MRTLICGMTASVMLALAGPAVDQEAINHASVAGRVTEETGGSVADARSEAHELSTGVRNAARTDAEGRFRLVYLKPGRYELTITAQGFVTARRTLTLAIGTAFDLPVQLKPGGVDAVTVTADATLIDAARSQISTVVGQQEAQSLPLNGRNFLDIALLVPGVSPTNVGGGTQLFPETSAVLGVGLSVSSQRNLSFRHIYPTNLRDMAVARSPGGDHTFDAPVRVSQDGWELTGCPEDGPALAVDDNNLVHIAWPTITGPGASRKGVFYAYSADEGRSFAPRIRLDEGTDVKHAQHPQMAAAGLAVVVVWDESTPAGTRIRARVVTAEGRDGKSPRVSPVVAVSEPGSVTYPAVAATTAG